MNIPQYGHEERLRVIRDAHPIEPGKIGFHCLADFEPSSGVLLRVVDEWVCCSACGNELGRTDQFMIKVWESESHRTKEHGTARLEFIG